MRGPPQRSARRPLEPSRLRYDEARVSDRLQRRWNSCGGDSGGGGSGAGGEKTAGTGGSCLGVEVVGWRLAEAAGAEDQVKMGKDVLVEGGFLVVVSVFVMCGRL